MDMLLGLGSLAGLSLFLSRVTNRSASLMPLVSVAACTLWFTLFGCLGLLVPAGWAWYALCLAGLVVTIVLDKADIFKRLTPGFLLFLLGGAFLITVFSATQPLLTQWDEFTFWGTAAKATTDSGQLYVVADSNLIARTYPPGLIVFNYAMQFFGGAFAEYKFMAALCLVYLAAFAAGGALLDKNRPAAVLLLACFVLLPLFFETGPAWGDISRAYLTCYADPSLAALFGGAIALYFGGGKPGASLLWMLAAVLAALTNIKDIGLALACLVALFVLVDLLAVHREDIRFYGLKKGKAWWCWLGILFGAIVLAYVGWLLYLKLSPAGVNRANLGSAGGEDLDMFTMLITGVLALFGINRTEQFRTVSGEMLYALVDTNRPVSLLGPGVRVFLIIALLLVFAWLLASTKQMRRRILAFAIVSTVGFVLFYIFNIFTYSFIFQQVEAKVLKDYDRYIFPYWQGWLAGALVLLGGSAVPQAEGKKARWRVEAARLTLVGVALCFVGVVALRGNAGANVLNISPSLYTERWYIADLVQTATAEGMADDDVVYILNQDDDGTHFYMLGYEMKAARVPLYSGTATDANGNTVLVGNASTRLVHPESGSTRSYATVCTPEILSAYLQEQGCTGLLVDFMDDAFYEDYIGMFADGLAGWLPDGTNNGGPRYYAIEWRDGDVLCTFVPMEGGAA